MSNKQIARGLASELDQAEIDLLGSRGEWGGQPVLDTLYVTDVETEDSDVLIYALNDTGNRYRLRLVVESLEEIDD